MDLELPRMDGVEAITAIRREYPNARVIALTMYQGDEDIHRAVQAGAAAYLLKDTVPEVLIRVIHDVHAGRRVFPPEILAAIKGRAGQPALTSREVQVLELLAEGKRTKEIAAALGVTSDTANAHIKNIYSKFAVHGRGAVVSEAIRRGFIRRERSTFLASTGCWCLRAPQDRANSEGGESDISLAPSRVRIRQQAEPFNPIAPAVSMFERVSQCCGPPRRTDLWFQQRRGVDTRS